MKKPLHINDDKNTLAHVYSMILGWGREEEEKNIDISVRRLKWEREKQFHWNCIVESPYEGSVSLDKSNAFWVGHAYHKTIAKSSIKVFSKPDEAMEWVEQELERFQSDPDILREVMENERLDHIEQFVLTEEYRKALAPFWIEPELLEPDQITYQVYLDVELNPISFDRFELSTGEVLHINQKYMSVY